MRNLKKLKHQTNFNFLMGMFVILVNVYSYSIGEHLLSIASLGFFCAILVYMDEKATRQNIRLLEDFGALVDDFGRLAKENNALRKNNETS